MSCTPSHWTPIHSCNPGATVMRWRPYCQRTARSQAPVAQRIEQQPSNLSVVGSIPTGGARFLTDPDGNVLVSGVGNELTDALLGLAIGIEAKEKDSNDDG